MVSSLPAYSFTKLNVGLETVLFTPNALQNCFINVVLPAPKWPVKANTLCFLLSEIKWLTTGVNSVSVWAVNFI